MTSLIFDTKKGEIIMSDKNWIYVNEDNNKVRYVLGYKGIKTLCCIGINCSTAEPDKLDPTLKSVERIALNNGYDSFIMFNVYPVRATNFQDLSKEKSEYYIKRNLEVIENQISSMKNVELWVAFGNLIMGRDYLINCWKDIKKIFDKYNASYYTVGLNKSGMPKHPLYQKSNSKLIPYN